MKCGKGHQHTSVAEVRACYGQPDTATQLRIDVPQGDTWNHRGSDPTTWNQRGGRDWRSLPAKDGQTGYITSLMARRGLEFAEGHAMPELRGPASDMIKALLVEGNVPPRTLRDFGLAYKSHAGDAASQLQGSAQVSAGTYPDVPAGHYAVPSRTGNNDLDFFRVDRPEEGTWKGRTFVKRVIGGHPDQNIRGREARLALEAVLKEGVEAARVRYGQEVGSCWKCNRHLTDETSRALGIGPDCRQKVA